MSKHFLALILLAITMMACSEPYDPNIKVVVNKPVFTMNIDDKDWVADSTLLMVSTARVGYNVAIGIKFSDKVKKIPAETIYLYVPNLQAGESVQLPSKTYRQADFRPCWSYLQQDGRQQRTSLIS